MERLVKEKCEELATLASQPLCHQFRDMKQGHVVRVRNSIWRCIEVAYIPAMGDSLEKLKDVLAAFATVMQAGEKIGNHKPSQVKEAVGKIKHAAGSLMLARTFITCPGGRQMLLDAEACTKQTSQDAEADLLLKKALEQESLNLQMLPLAHLELVYR